MKKTIFASIALLILFSSSCRKNIGNGGTWNFKGVNYNVMGCVAFSGYGQNVVSNSRVSAATSSSPDYELTVYFANPMLPQTSGSYIVIDTNNLSGNEVAISLRNGFNSYTGNGGTYYNAPGGNGRNQTVQVTVSSNRKISIYGYNIIMRNDTNPSDSGVLSFNIYQTSP